VARADITTYTLAINAGTTAIAGGTADANNGHQVAFSKSRRLVLRINEGTSAAGTWTIKAGAGSTAGPAQKAGQGDLVILPGASETKYVVVESARFMQADGKLYVDVNSVPGTRTIAALRLPAVA